MSKANVQTISSPKGELMWLFITGEGKKQIDKNKPNKFEASVRFKDDDPELLKFEKEVKAFWKENKPTPKATLSSTGIKKEYIKNDDGDKEYTGYSLIVFKTGVTFPDGKAKVITVHNAKGDKVNMGDKLIGNGSIGYILGAMAVYPDQGSGAGVTLYLNAVQLTKFVEYTGGVETVEDEGWDGSDLDDGIPAPDRTKAPAKINLEEDDIPM